MSREIEGVYLSKVTIKDFNCFRGEQTISFTRPDGRYQQWNVILGNNNTGKTTILRLLSGLVDKKKIRKFLPLIPQIKIYQDRIISVDVVATISLQTVNNNKLIQIEDYPSRRDVKTIPEKIQVYGYGTSRRMSTTSISENTIEEGAIQIVAMQPLGS